MSIEIPVLHSERLTLRPFHPDDFDDVARFYADEVSALYGGPCDRATAWRKFATYPGHWMLKGFGPLAIEETETGLFVGWSGMWGPEGWPEPEITWALLPEFHGRGYATEAGRRSLRSAYEDLGWTTAISVIDDRNTASASVATRIGATRERPYEIFGNPGHIYRHATLEVLNRN